VVRPGLKEAGKRFRLSLFLPLSLYISLSLSPVLDPSIYLSLSLSRLSEKERQTYRVKEPGGVGSWL